MNIKKIIVLVAIAVVVGCLLGYTFGYSRGSKAVVASYTGKVAEVSKFFPSSQEVFSLSGKIKNIKNDVITIDADPITINPFLKENYPSVRQITVNNSTLITKIEQKNLQTFQKEMLAYQKLMQQNSVKETSIVNLLPKQFSENKMALSDLVAGDTITVAASSNISAATSFTATKIQLINLSTTENIPTPSQ